jgi:hypothetical protein
MGPSRYLLRLVTWAADQLLPCCWGEGCEVLLGAAVQVLYVGSTAVGPYLGRDPYGRTSFSPCFQRRQRLAAAFFAVPSALLRAYEYM